MLVSGSAPASGEMFPMNGYHYTSGQPDKSSSAVTAQQSKSPSPASLTNGLPEVPYTYLSQSSSNGFKAHSSSSSESTPLLVRTSLMNDKPDVIRNYVNVEPKKLRAHNGQSKNEQETEFTESSQPTEVKQVTQLTAEIHGLQDEPAEVDHKSDRHHHKVTEPKRVDAKEVDDDKSDKKESHSPTNSSASSSGNEVKGIGKSVTFDPNVKETERTRRVKSIRRIPRDEDVCSTCSSSSCSSSCSSEDDFDYDLSYSAKAVPRSRGTRIHYVSRSVKSEGSLRRSNSNNFRRTNTETCTLS